MSSSDSVLSSVLEGDRLALSRLLTQIENETPEGIAGLNGLFPYTGQAHLIGITGAPGTGKSSLVNVLAQHIRRLPSRWKSSRTHYERVGIVAVDPSSPFSGGAILGDRVRMRDLAGDPGIFIRSMASRGSLGGLARTTAGVVQALDAAGYGVILIETVGAGQAEVDIARLAHTTIVIEAPGLGDDIQAIKAGILEIADVLVVNKADRPGVEITERALRSMLELAHPIRRRFLHHGRAEFVQETASNNTADHIWVPPILRTVATEDEGIEKLAEQIELHYKYLVDSGELRNRESARLRSELDNLLQNTLITRWQAQVPDGQYQGILQKIVDRQLSPWQGVTHLIDNDWE